MNAKTTSVPAVLAGGHRPVWSSDDRELFYDDADHLFVVPIQTTPTVAAGPPTPLPIEGFIQGPLQSRRQYDGTPDGSRFLMMFRTAPQVDVVRNWFDEIRQRAPAK